MSTFYLCFFFIVQLHLKEEPQKKLKIIQGADSNVKYPI